MVLVGSPSGEELGHPVAQLVDVEVGGVDDDVGLGLHRLEQRPLLLDRLGQLLAVGRGWRRLVLS